MIEPLISVNWLNENLNDSNLIILDASQSDNNEGVNSEFGNQKIKGSKFFNLKDTFSDPNGVYPNTLPSQDQFEKECQTLGINNASRIVVYDNHRIHTSPRVWWMFKAMGHDNIHVLNGGLQDWILNGFVTSDGYNSTQKRGSFRAKLQSELIKNFNQIKKNIPLQENIVVDVRSEGRFNGTSQEPRKNLRSGHIPNSINIPFNSVLENGKYKPLVQLKEIFDDSISDSRPIIFTCGSGVTACIVLFAFDLVSKNSKSVYDGSWTEWASIFREGI